MSTLRLRAGLRLMRHYAAVLAAGAVAVAAFALSYYFVSHDATFQSMLAKEQGFDRAALYTWSLTIRALLMMVGVMGAVMMVAYAVVGVEYVTDHWRRNNFKWSSKLPSALRSYYATKQNHRKRIKLAAAQAASQRAEAQLTEDRRRVRTEFIAAAEAYYQSRGHNVFNASLKAYELVEQDKS